jgi:putative hemolysin
LDPSIVFFIVIFTSLLILSAFFSASETAFFSLGASELERIRKRTDASSRALMQLMEHPKRLLITIVIGNTIVNISAASLAAILTLRVSDQYGVTQSLAILIEVIVVTFVMLVFAEIMPKVAAVKNSRQFALRIVYILSFFYYIFSPVTSIFHLMTTWLSDLFRVNQNKVMLTEEELRTLVDFGQEKGTLQEDEKDMIHSIFEFGETTVKEIMVPRIDMICVSLDAQLKDLLELTQKFAHSRIPAYQDRVDNITGIIYAKDLLPFINKPESENFSVAKMARPAYFVPEQKKIDELLKEFQAERIHMAIVIDEYGGTAGLVTLEDIIEEIVGEIQDEYDTEPAMFSRVSENEFIVDGGMSLEEINDELELDLPTEEDVETLAGFLFGLFGSVPKEKQAAAYNGYEFIVEKIIRRRIKQVRIIKKGHE